jgi:glutamate-1-semialdehyde 2,1-aminomutase
MGERLRNGLKQLVEHNNIPAVVNSVGSLSCLLFSENEVSNYIEAKKSDTQKYGKFFKSMLDQGIYLAPAQFEAAFISYAHTEEEIDFTLECAEKALKSL